MKITNAITVFLLVAISFVAVYAQEYTFSGTPDVIYGRAYDGDKNLSIRYAYTIPENTTLNNSIVMIRNAEGYANYTIPESCFLFNNVTFRNNATYEFRQFNNQTAKNSLECLQNDETFYTLYSYELFTPTAGSSPQYNDHPYTPITEPLRDKSTEILPKDLTNNGAIYNSSYPQNFDLSGVDSTGTYLTLGYDINTTSVDSWYETVFSIDTLGKAHYILNDRISTNSFVLEVNSGLNRLALTTWNTSGTASSAISSVPNLETNKIYHAVVVIDNSNRRSQVYLDNELIINISNAGGDLLGNSNLPPRIGFSTGGTNRYMDGKVYSHRSFIGIPTTEQLTTLYNNGSVSDGLVASYPFDSYVSPIVDGNFSSAAFCVLTGASGFSDCGNMTTTPESYRYDSSFPSNANYFGDGVYWYVPSLNVSFDLFVEENSSNVLSAVVIGSGSGNWFVEWFKNAVSVFSEWVGWGQPSVYVLETGFQDEGDVNFTVEATLNSSDVSNGTFISESFVVTVLDTFPVPDTPSGVFPRGGTYEFSIPVVCEYSYVPLNPFVIEWVRSVNGSSYEGLNRNTTVPYLVYDISLDAYGSTYSFGCRVSSISGSSDFAYSGNITKSELNHFYMFEPQGQKRYSHMIPYTMGYYMEFNNVHNISLYSGFVDCTGNGLWDYAFRYDEGTTEARETFSCLNARGRRTHTVGMVLYKNNSVDWGVAGCNGLYDSDLYCAVYKTYELVIE